MHAGRLCPACSVLYEISEIILISYERTASEKNRFEDQAAWVAWQAGRHSVENWYDSTNVES